MTDKIKAIVALNPNANVTVRGEEVEWIDGNPTNITDEQISAKQIELQTEYDAQDYARKRKLEYPSIEECVHAILDDDLTSLQEKRYNKYKNCFIIFHAPQLSHSSGH